MKRGKIIRLIAIVMVAIVVIASVVMLFERMGEEKSGPEKTVHAWFDTYAAKDAEKFVSLFVPEQREQMAEITMPDVSFSNLKIETISQTEETAEITAAYDIELTINGKTEQSHTKLKFGLEKRDSEWLISKVEPIETEVASVEVLVHDEENNPISEADVNIYNVKKEIIHCGVTNDEGIVIFEGVPAPDDILVTKDRYGPAMGWNKTLGEPYKVQLKSFESLGQENTHVVWVAVDPPFLSIAQGGSETVSATLFSFNRSCNVSVIFDWGYLGQPDQQITLELIPEDVTLPDTGQERLRLSLKVDASVAPGIYEVYVAPKVLEEERPSEAGYSKWIQGQKLTIKVTPTE